MKRFYFIAALLSLAISTSAGAQNFSEVKMRYHGTAVVSEATELAGSSNYTVSQDLIVNDALYIRGSGSIRVHGNLVANAPIMIQGSGHILVDGDIIARNAMNIQGSGHITSMNKIYVIRNKGSLNKQGSGYIEGEIVYSDDAGVVLSPRPVAVAPVAPAPTRTTTTVRSISPKKIVRSTTVVTDEDTDDVEVYEDGRQTQRVNIGPGGISVYNRDGADGQTVHIGR